MSECWERIHLSCIVKDFSCIQREPSQKWRIEYNIMKKTHKIHRSDRIQTCIPVTMMYFVCFFMILYSIRHFWLGSRCIQEKSFTIQERWILSQHSDTIFRSPTCLASEIYTFVTCHYDVFCVFFHDIVLDSSFLTGFPLYTRVKNDESSTISWKNTQNTS